MAKEKDDCQESYVVSLDSVTLPDGQFTSLFVVKGGIHGLLNGFNIVRKKIPPVKSARHYARLIDY
jgi:hypothetical protein